MVIKLASCREVSLSYKQSQRDNLFQLFIILIIYIKSIIVKKFYSSQVWFQNRRTKWRKKSATEPSSTQTSRGENAGDGSENEVEDEEYNKPLDPDTDDEKIRQLLRKHRRAFSVLRLGPHHVWMRTHVNYSLKWDNNVHIYSINKPERSEIIQRHSDK